MTGWISGRSEASSHHVVLVPRVVILSAFFARRTCVLSDGCTGPSRKRRAQDDNVGWLQEESEHADAKIIEQGKESVRQVAATRGPTTARLLPREIRPGRCRFRAPCAREDAQARARCDRNGLRQLQLAGHR